MNTPITGFPSNLRAQSVTIASGASASEMIATQGDALVAIIMPSAWTAAHIGYKGCITGRDGDLQQIYDNSGNPEKTIAVAAHLVAGPQSDAVFVPWLQLLSVNASDDTTAVTQAADRTLILLFKSYLN